MNKTTAYGSIKNGKLTLANRKRFEQDCREFKDGPIELTIKKKNRRSNNQNAWYWGCVIEEIRIRMNDLGNRFDADTVHSFLKGKFNTVQVIDKEGVLIGDLPGSTTEMNKGEFSEYCDKIVQWAAEFLEISIPAPNTQTSFFTAEYDEETSAILIQDGRK